MGGVSVDPLEQESEEALTSRGSANENQPFVVCRLGIRFKTSNYSGTHKKKKKFPSLALDRLSSRTEKE